jgi:hypothetical protein
MLGELKHCTEDQLVQFFYEIITRPGPLTVFSQTELDQLEAEQLRRTLKTLASDEVPPQVQADVIEEFLANRNRIVAEKIQEQL